MKIINFAIIDAILLVLLLKILYTSALKGPVVEVAKFINVLVSTFFSFHFYGVLPAEFIAFLNYISLSKETGEFIWFVLIFSIVWLIVFFVTGVISQFFKKIELSNFERAIALFIGIIRFLFIASIIIFTLEIFPINPVRDLFLYQSRISNFFARIAPLSYLKIANLVKNFNDSFAINQFIKDYYEARKNLSENS